MFGRILVDDAEANKSIAKTDKNAKGLGERLGQGIKTAAKWGAALLAGATVALGAMVALGKRVGDMADEILDLNSITGMSTENLQRWRKAAEVAGVATDAVAKTSEKFTKSLSGMTSETNKGNIAMRELGFSLEDIEGMSADERMNALTDSLAGIDDKTHRARLGADLFGGSWSDIAPIVDLGTEAMNKAKDSANIISQEDLEKANEFRISLANMKDQASFFVTEIGIKLLPMLQGLFDWVQDKMPMIQNVAGIAFAFIGEKVEQLGDFIREHILPIFNEFWDWLEPHLPRIQEIFMESFGKMKDVFLGLVDAIKTTSKWMKDHWDIVGPIFIGIAAAIVTFQLITAAIAAYGAITKAITAIQLIFNAALSMNPIGLVVIAIGLLVAAGILLWKNWDVVKDKASQFWKFMKDVMRDPVNFILGAINMLIGAYERMINGLSSAINAIPSISIPDWVPGFGGKSFGIPNIPTITLPKIPMLEKGGNVEDDGMFIAGEAGPELFENKKGARVTPLDDVTKGPIYQITINEPHVWNNMTINELGRRIVEQIRVKTGVKI